MINRVIEEGEQENGKQINMMKYNASEEDKDNKYDKDMKAHV